MDVTPTQGADQLRQYIERVERLEEEKRALMADFRDVYSEAKHSGFDPKTMRQISQNQRDGSRSAGRTGHPADNLS